MADGGGLRHRIASVLGPGLAKTASSWEQLCEARAASIYGDGVERSGGNRASAKRAGVDERTIRDRRTTARGIALKDVLQSLDREGIYRVADLLCDFADELEGRTGSDG